MSLSEIVIKIIGLVLAIVGLSLILSAVGIQFLGAGFSPVWLEVVVGVCLIGAGIWIIRGGTISL
jgi:hypothetical protein